MAAMDHINKHFDHIPKYFRLQKPLQAADVCGKARELADGQYDVISFNDGLLTLSTTSSAAASNLRMKTFEIQNEINEKLGKELVKKVRIKIQ